LNSNVEKILSASSFGSSRNTAIVILPTARGGGQSKFSIKFVLKNIIIDLKEVKTAK